MPTPAKTSREELVSIALGLVETGGVAALTVSAVAKAAGIKGPSIYKHFTDRLALLRAAEIEVIKDLEAVLRASIRGRTARARIVSLANAYRGFAKSQPHRYELLYSRNIAGDPELAAASRSGVQPLFDELRAAGVPDARLLTLARTLTAFMHGFVSMELVGAFRLGGDLERDFQDSLATILSEIPG